MKLAKSNAARAAWLRLVGMSALLMLLVAAASVLLSARQLDSDWQRSDEAGTRESAQAARSMLQSRLAAGEAVARALTALDAGGDGARLRRAIDSYPMFNGAVALPWAEATASLPVAPVALVAGDRLSLRSGKTLLRFVNVNHAPAPYLIRATTMGGVPAFAYLALDPRWLWAGLGGDDSGQIAVVADGAVLKSSAQLQAGQRRALTQSAGDGGDARRSWQADGVEWRGNRQILSAGDSLLVGSDWSIYSFARADARPGAWSNAQPVLPWLALLALALALAHGWYWRRRWLPGLQRLQRGLSELADGRLEHVSIGHEAELPHELAQDFNRAIDAVTARQGALRSLAEIDRLLLESRPLESALDRVLSHFRAITSCQGAALVLPDSDAPGHGRAYTSVAEDVDLPVSRVGIDGALLEDLRSVRDGLTVTRCEPERHSLLEPLRGVGCEFFWLWPAVSEGKVVAVLAAGYSTPPAVAGELALYGNECAARLSMTIHNHARDNELYRQAHFDTLTGLPNRLLFRDRLSQELAAAANSAQRGALAYIDLDYFKKINDNFGHATGDQLLQVVAQRLRTCVKDSDTVARLGGDEFAVILRQAATAEGARTVADRIVQALHMPVSIGGRDHHIRVSVGITMYPDDGASIEDLIQNADLAMYQAKDSGRAQIAYYSPTMQQKAAVIESGLFRALRRREFSLYFQPQYSLASNQLEAVEALLRWQPPRQNMRLPGDFIPAAEQSGLIVDIGAWVLESACSQFAVWREQGIAPPRLALNVSVQQLRQPEFVRLVQRALEQSRLPSQLLEIEITESVFADDDARQSMQQLAALGVRLALDDFGTGYSSLGFLRQHPVQVIKIDRSFIEEVPTSITAATLAETMIVMAHALGKQVVAEGVETAEQLEFLRERRCDMAQGYYLSRPRSLEDIGELLNSRRMPGHSPERMSA